MTTASAPGKVILCGEHAVVYGQPAIALPLPGVRSQATIEAAPFGAGIRLNLADLGESRLLEAEDHPLATLVRLTIAEVGTTLPLDLSITLRSAIPIASGMGSGAALGAALVNALSAYLGRPLDPAAVSRLVYESECFYHGTPSGIDNTVVSYEQAIWFMRGQEQGGTREPPTIEPLHIGAPLALVLGDTGVHAPTHITVSGVRERWRHDRENFDALFSKIGRLVVGIRRYLADGDLLSLGAALNRNQELLREIGVSSPELERLISAALAAGALGAKLSGGGGGGIMLALAAVDHQEPVSRALLEAGATRVTETVVT